MRLHLYIWFVLILILLGAAAYFIFWNSRHVETRNIEYYCPMHPQIVRTDPGSCPICGMTLIEREKNPPTGDGKKSKSEQTDHQGMNMPGMDMDSMAPQDMGISPAVPEHAAVIIPGELQQRIGVKIGRVEKGPLKMSVQALGTVQPDETRIARVNIKTEGWIDKVFVNFVGRQVQKGDSLLSIYSPNFLSTQQELLAALRAEQIAGVWAGRGQTMADAARRRLELWDVPPDEIDRMLQTGKPEKDLVLKSPISGTVLERNVYEKQYVTPDRELYVIGDLSTIWIQAEVYEYEIPHVELGQPAAVTVPSLPDRQFSGKVVFIQPVVEKTTRTVQVRIELPNKEGIFKPGMYAQISIAHPMGEGLLAPVSAILRTGRRDIAYRVEPGGRFVPVSVKISPIRFGDQYEILEGLKEGEQVVTSANFLIDSESRIRAGGGGMSGMDMSEKTTPAN